MEAREVLIRFLGATLAEKRERVCGFASKTKTQPKFFELLYHTLGQYFSPSAISTRLPDAAWSSPAFAFVAPNEFGLPVDSLRDAYNRFGEGEGALLVSTDGLFGIWCDHTYVDARVLIAVQRAA